MHFDLSMMENVVTTSSKWLFRSILFILLENNKSLAQTFEYAIIWNLKPIKSLVADKYHAKKCIIKCLNHNTNAYQVYDSVTNEKCSANRVEVKQQLNSYRE